MQTPGNAQNFNYVRGWLWKSLTITPVSPPCIKELLVSSQTPSPTLNAVFPFWPHIPYFSSLVKEDNNYNNVLTRN